MKFIILGCGSSMGFPRPDGFFGNCDPKNKKCPEGYLIIDPIRFSQKQRKRKFSNSHR